MNSLLLYPSLGSSSIVLKNTSYQPSGRNGDSLLAELLLLKGVPLSSHVGSISSALLGVPSTPGELLLIYIWNFHVLCNLLLIYICELHLILNTMFVCQVNYFWFTYIISMSYVIYYWFTHVNSTGKINTMFVCQVNFLLIYICNFHVLNHLLLIYIC